MMYGIMWLPEHDLECILFSILHSLFPWLTKSSDLCRLTGPRYSEQCISRSAIVDILIFQLCSRNHQASILKHSEPLVVGKLSKIFSPWDLRWRYAGRRETVEDASLTKHYHGVLRLEFKGHPYACNEWIHNSSIAVLYSNCIITAIQ